ncbi:XRE family transcriptional regulator [Halobacillus sp. A5]|uniref:XRE family transcriptional regulator n=1 Tax=Halobacillus sp. A5 TaxID=2880263 RepID=UPI0020A66F3F|nr:XRE family transcriptional regulator [Halobacillus sp. A5]MCP3026643.1 XRE family transcriptional regulator [Halobacillus sp. A5]
MTIRDELVKARNRQETTQLELSFDANYCRETISKVETGDRKYQPEMRKAFSESLDDPEFYFHSWEEATGYVHMPYLNGDHIQHDSIHMRFFVEKETKEALEHLDHVKWYKPIASNSEQEKEEVKRVIKEILDSAASQVNLVAALCKEYDFSMKKLFKEWLVSLKARRFKK